MARKFMGQSHAPNLYYLEQKHFKGSSCVEYQDHHGEMCSLPLF